MIAIIDNYDMDLEVIGFGETMKEVDALCDQQARDTDGECYLLWVEVETSEDYNPREDYYAGRLSKDFGGLPLCR